VIPGYS